MAKKNTKQEKTMQEKTPRLTVTGLATEMRDMFAQMAATIAAQNAVIAELKAQQNTSAPTQEKSKSTSKKSTSKKSTSKKSTSKKSTSKKSDTQGKRVRVPFPAKEVWLAFKKEHADEVANLATQKERNKALWKIYAAEQTAAGNVQEQVERPSRDEWLNFKAEHADEVANLATKKERNSALWKLYVAKKVA